MILNSKHRPAFCSLNDLYHRGHLNSISFKYKSKVKQKFRAIENFVIFFFNNFPNSFRHQQSLFSQQQQQHI